MTKDENRQINGLEEKYLQYTDYHHFPGGRKRLRIITKYCEKRSLRLGRRLRVLDVGCGNGAISLPVASLDHSLLGIDISPESVELASHKNLFPNARFMVHNLMEKSLPEKFDLVICSEVLEHLPEPESLMRAMAEVLEPGGLMVITVPNGYGPREVFGRLERWLKRSRAFNPLVERFRTLLRMCSAAEKCRMHTSNPDQAHEQKFTPSRMRQLIESGGLQVIDWVNSFWLLSLFGQAKAGTNLIARFDSWLANFGPTVCSSGWYIICEKRNG
jgi:2-polyprenyl-3-methyl-5-hydroxy-6-metoxy-1,4-benzoquinol methylase